VHGVVELLEELLVFFLAAFGGEAQRIPFLTVKRENKKRGREIGSDLNI
jgi:hypothetical protein